MTDLEFAERVWEQKKEEFRQVVDKRKAGNIINGAATILRREFPDELPNGKLLRYYQAIGRLEVELARWLHKRD